jgi:hypothetical protein
MILAYKGVSMSHSDDFRALMQQTRTRNQAKIKTFVPAYNQQAKQAFWESQALIEAILENPLLESIEGIFQTYLDQTAQEENAAFSEAQAFLVRALKKGSTLTEIQVCLKSIEREKICHWLEQLWIYQVGLYQSQGRNR